MGTLKNDVMQIGGGWEQLCVMKRSTVERYMKALWIARNLNAKGAGEFSFGAVFGVVVQFEGW